MTGEWSYYDSSGVMMRKFTLDWFGDFDGDFVQFHPNEAIYVHGHYSRGKACGEWIWYDKNGDILEKIVR